jgi:hypothetical protein
MPEWIAWAPRDYCSRGLKPGHALSPTDDRSENPQDRETITRNQARPQ